MRGVRWNRERHPPGQPAIALNDPTPRLVNDLDLRELDLPGRRGGVASALDGREDVLRIEGRGFVRAAAGERDQRGG